MVGVGLLTRYLVGRVLLGVLAVSLLLVGLYTLIELVRETRALGDGYGLPQMLWYLAQTTPRRLYDIFPFAALIGALMGLGTLASGNELVAMRAAGFDRRQVALRALFAIALCLLVLVILSETAIPRLESQARAEREAARSGQVYQGQFGSLWLRDGPRVIRIGYSAWLTDDQLEFGDLLVYELGADMLLERVLTADRARHDGVSWQLEQVERWQVGQGAGREFLAVADLSSGLSPELFAATVARPRLLPTADLLDMLDFLARNELDQLPYQRALWARIVYPLNVLVMVLVGLPFVFRGSRQQGQGLRLFAGVGLGLLVFVLVRLFEGLAAIMPIPVWLTSMLPALVISAGLLLVVRRS
ncbi:MAG: LPS export ABC transporter permease LptG [Wenzhouxiangella sp.]|nr:MAG: LPS export ABC transporter permease LptG [Wenzhouxiangella sp.]